MRQQRRRALAGVAAFMMFVLGCSAIISAMTNRWDEYWLQALWIAIFLIGSFVFISLCSFAMGESK